MIGAAYLEKLQARFPLALREAAELVLERARELVPVRSGRLRDSLQVEGNSVVTDVPYALEVELEQPFMREALLQSREHILETLK